MAVEVEPPMEVNNNAKNAEFHKQSDQNTTGDDDKNDVNLTPYERLTRELQNDEKIFKEISSGRRIGFYRIRGDLGSGNFSQVKLGFHCIAKGKQSMIYKYNFVEWHEVPDLNLHLRNKINILMYLFALRENISRALISTAMDEVGILLYSLIT